MELGEIDVESTVETERCCDGGDNLSDESIKIRVSWSLDVQIATANVIYRLVVDHECAVGMLQCGVGREDGIVGLNDRSGNLQETQD